MNHSDDSPLQTNSPLAESLLIRLLLVSWIAFSALLIYLLNFPEKILFLFPAVLPIILIIFLCYELMNPERKLPWEFLTLLVMTFLMVLLWRQLGKKEIAFILAVIFSAIILMNLAGYFFERMTTEISEHKKKIESIEQNIKVIAQENQFYLSHIPDLKFQIGTQKRLSSFSREIGTLLDPEMIKQKLIEKLQNLFQNEEVSLNSPSLEHDPIDHWLTEKKVSLLIKDLSADKRFSLMNRSVLSRSVIAVPLMMEKSLIGLIRIDSKTPNRFIDTELQQLELYTHISSLALENAQLFLKVNAMATKDGLTGLATHRIFQEKLSEEILRSARYRTELSLIMLDIDHFKSINDHYGHLTGDQVLKEISRMINGFCRPVDFAARYGGEEFALILPKIGMKETLETAETLRQNIEQYHIHTPEEVLRVTVSIGCAAFPQDAQNSNQLIRKADERLYKAKASGRNRVVIE